MEKFLRFLRLAKFKNWETIDQHLNFLNSQKYEEIVYERTPQYFTHDDVLFPRQSCFQLNNSTFHAILILTKVILTNFEETQYALGVL